MHTLSNDDVYALVEAATTFGRIYNQHPGLFGIGAYSIHVSESEVIRLGQLFDLPVEAREYTDKDTKIVYIQSHVSLFGVGFHSQVKKE